MLPLPSEFCKKEKRRCGAPCSANFCHCPAFAGRGSLAATLPECEALASRAQFQAFQSGDDAEADLALDAERLQCDRIVRSPDQYIAAGPTAPDSRLAKPSQAVQYRRD